MTGGGPDPTEHPVPDFEDLRHDSDHVRPTEGNLALLLDATLAATDIVIASPLYWYSVSAHTKRYLDHWSGRLRTVRVRVLSAARAGPARGLCARR